MSPSRRPGNAHAIFAFVNGGASREARRPIIAPGARQGRAPCRGQSRGMQNSQRVLLAMPRTAPMARRRDEDIAPYRQAARGGARQWGTRVEHCVGHSEGVRQQGRESGSFCRFSRFRFEKTAVFKKNGLRYNQIVAFALGSIHFHSWLYKIYVPIRSGSIKFCSDWGLSPLLLLL